MKKDIVLIIGGGGMSGVFSAGVLKAFERDEIFNRIHSVYAVSVGACNGARFLVKQSELGGSTFWTYFNNNKFIKGHFVRYFFQVLRHKHNPNTQVNDVLDFDYFTHVILHSKDNIDVTAVAESPIPFYVKVFSVQQGTHKYLTIKNPQAYEKIIASASLTPLTAKSVEVNGEELFDGNTIPSRIEEEVIKNNPDKTIIKICNQSNSILTLCNIPVLIIISILLWSKYGKTVAQLYVKNFFKKTYWNNKLHKYQNVHFITHSKRVGIFCKKTKTLKQAYANGVQKGYRLTEELRA